MGTISSLSQAIEEKVIIKVVMNMNKKGYTCEQIVEIVEKSLEEVRDIIKKESLDCNINYGKLVE